MISAVSSQPVTEFTNTTSKRVRRTSAYLEQFYKDFPFYRRKIPDYLCGLAARYAGWTMPRDVQRSNPQALISYSLWLSLVWIIDGMSDSGRLSNLARITKIIRREKLLHDPDPLEDLVGKTYLHYLELIKSERRCNPKAYRKSHRWLLRYLGCQGQIPANLRQYRRHRLRDGGMMCVMWQLAMYKNRHPSKQLNRVFSEVALITSLDNDLLSFDRDLHQKTPNLLEHLGGDDAWNRFGRGVKLIDRLYRKVIRRKLDIDARDICVHVLNGAHNWSLAESRYASGVELLRLWENGDRVGFDSLLDRESFAVDGDPIPSPVGA